MLAPAQISANTAGYFAGLFPAARPAGSGRVGAADALPGRSGRRRSDQMPVRRDADPMS
ncbi:MAG TPA: hypothetical protein VMC03_02745 [Streptosporangiaceae bacterium]|nr:hypothetical protein [Streptosporangiaceae bacterium]